MRDLAGRILPVYQENDQDRYLHNLSGLQTGGGKLRRGMANAVSSCATGARASMPAVRIGRSVIYDIYAYARSREAEDKGPFTKTYPVAYRAIVSSLGDQDANTLTGWLNTPVVRFRDAVQRALRPVASEGQHSAG